MQIFILLIIKLHFLCKDLAFCILVPEGQLLGIVILCEKVELCTKRVSLVID